MLTDDQQHVLALLRKYSDNPSGFLALNAGNRYFRDDRIEGVVCYREAGRHWIVFGGPIADEADKGDLLDTFRVAAHRAGRAIAAVQIPGADAGLFADRGMRVNQLGMSYGVKLADFSLRGKKFVKLRNKISRADRLGVEVVEAGLDGHEAALAEIDARWLRSKGRFTKELEFMVGEVGGPAQDLRRLFLARLDGRPIAYISFSPVYGEHGGWLHDLSRRLPDSPPGVMEAINACAIEKFRAEGVPCLHFGFTPFTGLAAAHGLGTAHPRVDRLFGWLARKGNFLYPAQSQLEYKMKWNPTYLVPDYLAFENRLSPSLVFSLATVANLI